MDAQRVKAPDYDWARSCWMAARMWAVAAAIALVFKDDWLTALAAALTAGLALLIGFVLDVELEIGDDTDGD